MSGMDEDRDLLAAEFVLGVLAPDEHQAVAREALSDAGLRAAIDAWQARLSPLATGIAPVAPPPDLWGRIAAALPTDSATILPTNILPWPKRAWRSPVLWRAATVASLAIAASLAIVLMREPPRQPGMLVAALAPSQASTGPAWVAELAPNGTIALRPTAAMPMPSDHDLELWALLPGGKAPFSLGLMPPTGASMPNHAMPPQTQLMVSLEPKGGSTTGSPTGPVLYAGTLIQVD